MRQAVEADQDEAVTAPWPSLLSRAARRSPLSGHDGRSGADLERVELENGAIVVVKTSRPEDDLTATIAGARPDRELVLWAEGTLDDLPAGVAHCILDARSTESGIVTVMRDLGHAVVSGQRSVGRSECDRILRAAAALHARHAERPPEVACRLEDRLTMFAPATVERLADSGHALPRAVLRGWNAFADLVPAPVVDAVMAVLDEPAPLAGALRRTAPSTLLHGDLWLVNLALEPDQVTLLDWGLATAGPAVVDFASFLAGNVTRVRATRDQVIADFRSAEAEEVGDAGLRLGLLAGLLELGWNKALGSVRFRDPVARAGARADLDWWVAAALPALEGDL